MGDEIIPLNENNDPVSNALTAIDEDNFDSFKAALTAGVDFKKSNHMCIFEKALATHGRVEYVKECLKLGCMSNYINKDLNKAAINFAIDSHDPKVLNEILEHSNLSTSNILEKLDIDHIYEKLTPLNSLAKNLSAQNATEVVACMKLLMSEDASVYIPDQDQLKPLDHALSHYSELDESMKYEFLRLFLDHDKNSTLIDDVKVRDILEKDYPELNRELTRTPYLTGDIEKLKRNIRSIDNQNALFRNIANKDVKAFRDVLKNEADPLYLLLHSPISWNPFEEALQTHGGAEIVKECLKYGCKADYINEDHNEAAINYAIESHDPEIVNVLLSERNILVNVNHQCSSYLSPDSRLVTPIYALAEKLHTYSAVFIVIKACMELLLKYGASPDIPNKHGMTPLLYVLKMRLLNKEQKLEIVNLLLEYDAHTDIYRGDEILHIMQRDYPDLELPITSAEITFEILLEHLRTGNELLFVHLYQRFKVNSTECQKNELLRNAIDLRRYTALDGLLQTDAHATDDFIKEAFRKRDSVLLRSLLKPSDSKDYSELFLDLYEDCMREMCKTSEANKKFHELKKCFLVLLKSKCVDINKHMPLYIAVSYGSHFALMELLKHGAFIGGLRSTDFFHFPTELLEEHFNNCITSNKADLNDRNFRIIMDYKNLLPNEQPPGNSDKIQNQQTKGQNSGDLLIPIDSKNLLTKEQRTDRIQIKDMTAIELIANSGKHRHLLQHPLITSYIFVKWHRFSRLFYFNFFFYLLFATFFITHTILKFHKSEYQASTTLFGMLSWIGISYLIVRELTQVLMSPAIYFRSPINYVELVLIGFSIGTCSAPNFDQDTKRGIAAIAIMLIALDLCLLVGSLPILFISTHMMMLRAVCSSFLKILGLFSIFIFMFSLCFYIALSKSKSIVHGNASDKINVIDTQVPEVGFSDFWNYKDSFIKTLVMFTGEFDAGALNFNTDYGYFIFFIFVIFMPIVLLNLLNGLAVYDTQAIKAQAELHGWICRANLLIRYEKLLTEYSRFITFLKKHERIRAIYYQILNFWFNNTNINKISIKPHDRNKVQIITITILQVLRKFEPCKCSEMDGQTAKSAMAILEQNALAEFQCRRDELQQQELKNKEKKFEDELQTVKEKLSEVLKVLQDIKEMNVKETESNKDKIGRESEI